MIIPGTAQRHCSPPSTLATGEVIGKCYQRHRAKEFKKFLIEIEAHVPEGLDVHLIIDNYATHKTPAIRNWLARLPALARAFHAHQRLMAEHGSNCFLRGVFA